jgi:hypothetical protein
MKQLSYILLFLLTIFPASAISASKMLVIGGPPAVTTNDSVYGSKAGAHWQTYLNKSQKTYGAWNPTTGKSVINRLVGADYSNVSKSGNAITVYDAWPGVDYTVTFNNPGWTESGTITSAAGMTFQVYRATDIANVSVSGDTIYFGAAKTAFISPMKAWDANGVAKTVTQTVTSLGVQQGYPTWRMKYQIDTTGVVYPVTFDPSATITPVANSGARISGPTDTFTNTRDAATGSKNSFNITAGVQWVNPTWVMYRGFLTFPTTTIPAGAVVDSATVDLYGTADNSTIDTLLYLVSGFAGTLPVAADYISFKGRTAAAAHVPTYMSDSINTSGYTAGYGNIWHLSANALDTLEVADTLKVALLSAHDILNHTPASADAWINYDASDAGNDPKLTVYYHFPDGISAVSVLDSTRIIVTFDTTGTGAAAGDTLHMTYSSAGDTVKATGFTLIGTNGLTDTVTVPYADSDYTVQARHSHTAGGYYTYLNNTGTVRTRAAATAPLMGGWSQKSIFFKAVQGSNRPNTHMALICSTAAFGPRTLTVTGDTTALADSSFNKFSTWSALDSIFSYPRFVAATKPSVWAVWKNGDSLTTARSATIADSTFGAITTTAGFLDSTRVTGTTSIASVPSWVTTLSAWLSKSSGTVADSAVSDTSALSPGTAKLDTASSKVALIRPNQVVALRAVIKLNNRDSLAASSIDSIFTDPDIQQFTLSIVHTADTAMVPTISIGTNPGWTRFTLIDSTLVDADSTKIYYGPTALSATPTWYDTLYFTGTANDTIHWARNSGVLPNDSTNIFIIAASGDSTQGAP